MIHAKWNFGKIALCLAHYKIIVIFLVTTIFLSGFSQISIAEDCSKEATAGNAVICLQEKINQLHASSAQKTDIIPKGFILPFNGESCPTGWSRIHDANGRTIVGSGKGPGLSPRFWKEHEGEETHKLEIPELPIHQHDTTLAVDEKDAHWDIGPRKWSVAGSGNPQYSTGLTKNAGAGIAHNNMPPFYVLTYCVKK